jgi:lipoic acid synthetase
MHINETYSDKHQSDSTSELPERKPRPEWLKVRAPGGENYTRLRTLIRSHTLHTVCEEAHCPNIGECWNAGTASFMILGETCSRACRFCAVHSGKPSPLDLDEPQKLAETIQNMKLRHAVITSVTRDDLPDGGAEIWRQTILEIKRLNPDTSIEVLIPDFNGDLTLLKIVIDANPDILNHNVETVPRLYKQVRPKSFYSRSLNILKESKLQNMITKTGIMVGIGETKEEVLDVMNDLINIKVDILTIGQYLQPTQKHLKVERFVHPDEFEEYRQKGLELGFKHVESGPLVRSSYHAEKHV